MPKSIMIKKQEHPYIEINSKIASGKPIIRRTRTKVLDVAIRFEYMGMSPDEIIQQFPHLTLAQIHDALSYYYENKGEIDNDYVEVQNLVEELKKIYPSKLEVKI